MKKIFLSILILSVYFSSGCLGNRKSALERFKEKNPIDGMIFSENIIPSIGFFSLNFSRADFLLPRQPEEKYTLNIKIDKNTFFMLLSFFPIPLI